MEDGHLIQTWGQGNNETNALTSCVANESLFLAPRLTRYTTSFTTPRGTHRTNQFMTSSLVPALTQPDVLVSVITQTALPLAREDASQWQETRQPRDHRPRLRQQARASRAHWPSSMYDAPLSLHRQGQALTHAARSAGRQRPAPAAADGDRPLRARAAPGRRRRRDR